MLIRQRLLSTQLLYRISKPFGVAAPLANHAVRQRPGDTKIAQFDLGLVVNEDVGWLDVSVDDVGRVDELKAAQ